MHRHFLANPNVAEVKLSIYFKSYCFKSYNALKSVAHQASKELEMLLRRETNFFVRSLRHCVLIFNFSNIKHGYKIKIEELHIESLVEI